MFHNSTAIRSSLRGSGKGGWPGDELSAIDEDHTLIQLTQNEGGGGGEEKGQIMEVNLIPSFTLNNVQERNSAGVHPISGPRRRPHWPGEDLSSINNGHGTNNENNANNEDSTLNNENNENRGGGGVTDVLNPTLQSSIQEEEGGHQENEEHLTFSLEELGLSPEELETLTHPKISKNGVNPYPVDLGVRGSGRPQQGMGMAVEGVLQLPSKEICMGSEVKDIKLKVNYGTQEHEVLRMDLHQLMHLLNLISIPQPPPPSSSQEPGSSQDICAPDSPLTTPSSSSSMSSGSDSQRVPEVDHARVDKRNRRPLSPGHSNRTKPKVILPKSTPKVKLPKGRGVHHNSSVKTGGKVGWRYFCYFCTKRFRDSYDLNRHNSIHTMEKPFPCDQCTKRFNKSGNLNAHKRLHALDPAIRRPFKCQECGQSFTQKGSLTQHVKTVHRGVKDVKCIKCAQMFGSKNDMMRHHNAVHLHIRLPCPKPGCGKTFSRKADLRQHVKQAHPKILQPIPE